MMKIAKALLTGERHRRENVECQDCIGEYKNKDLIVAALSDGAGSKLYARESAELIVDSSLLFFKTYGINGNDVYKKDLENFINGRIIDSGLPTDEMGGTLLVVAVCGDRYLIGHVGDGIIIGKTQQKFEILSYPENGEYLNETYFLPSKDNGEHFRLQSGTLKGPFCFILASDGISETLYNRTTQEIAQACNSFELWNRKYTEEECSDILRKNLEQVFSGYNTDDKSIIVMSGE